MKLLTVLGNRPQFVKAAVVNRALQQRGADIQEVIVHTGQHYDANLSDVFFSDLGIPTPHHHLQIGSASILEQISRMLPKLEQICADEQPDALMVYGDTNSTCAGALAAGHLNIPLVHIEAGERLFNRHNNPEEINRVVTDSLSTLCLTASQKAGDYLAAEGINPGRIEFVGDTMFDLFCFAQDHFAERKTLSRKDMGLEAGKYILTTLHRPENTDDPARLTTLMNALDNAPDPVVLPLHPRTRAALNRIGWEPGKQLKLIDPVGYYDLLYLLDGARLCLSDSGGLTREAFFSGTPAIMPIRVTPWPEIIASGWLKHLPPEQTDQLEGLLRGFTPPADRPTHYFGQGDAGMRIVAALQKLGQADMTKTNWLPPGIDPAAGAGNSK